MSHDRGKLLGRESPDEQVSYANLFEIEPSSLSFLIV